jgi:hypothetical protein
MTSGGEDRSPGLAGLRLEEGMLGGKTLFAGAVVGGFTMFLHGWVFI